MCRGGRAAQGGGLEVGGDWFPAARETRCPIRDARVRIPPPAPYSYTVWFVSIVSLYTVPFLTTRYTLSGLRSSVGSSSGFPFTAIMSALYFGFKSPISLLSPAMYAELTVVALSASIGDRPISLMSNSISREFNP